MKICNSMYEPVGYYAYKVQCQTEKNKYCVLSLICEILRMKQRNEYNKLWRNRLKDTENKLMDISGERRKDNMG